MSSMLRSYLFKFIPFFPLILLVLNVGTKSLYLTSQDIGIDEPFTIYHAQFGFATIIEQLKGYNNPPLYELLLHVWIRLFGIGPLPIRVFPLIFACLSPIALYYFGKRYFSLSVAIAGSLLLSVSYLLLYYSHDCRVYSLFTLLSILSMHYFLKLLTEGSKPVVSLVLFVVYSSLLIYAHYFGFFVLFFQALHLLFFYRKKMLRFTGYYALIFLAYSPQLYVLLSRMGDTVKHGTWLGPPSGFESLYNMLWAFSNFPFITVFCIILLIAGLIAAIKNISLVRSNKNLLLIVVWFVFPFLGMFLISYRVPMYLSRYLIFSLPAYYLLLVMCTEALIKNVTLRNIVLTTLILCFAFTLDLNPDKKQRMDYIAGVIKNLKDDRTAVVIASRDFIPSFTYYYNRNYFSAVQDNREYRETDSLLRDDHVYFINEKSDLDAIDKSKYKKLIYLAAGKESTATEAVRQRIRNENNFLCQSKLYENYEIHIFKID